MTSTEPLEHPKRYILTPPHRAYRVIPIFVEFPRLTSALTTSLKPHGKKSIVFASAGNPLFQLEKLLEPLKLLFVQRLCKSICRLIFCRCMDHFHFFSIDYVFLRVPDKWYMFRTAVKYRILSQGLSALVIGVYSNRKGRRHEEFGEEAEKVCDVA